jgi:molybdate transport system permease protein
MRDAVLLTLGTAALSTALILPPGLGLAWVLARREFPGKVLVETLVTLPLVLPPVATGLILLELLGRRGPFGAAAQRLFHVDLVFTWRAIVVAMAVMSFPLLVRSARVGFEGVNRRLEQIATTLGAGRGRVFLTVSLPLAAPGVGAGILLAFARALGEFGATILVAGSIPGRTQTMAVAIYQAVQLGHDEDAYRLMGVSALLACIAVFAGEWLARRRRSA